MANLQESLGVFGGIGFFKHLIKKEIIMPFKTVIVIVERKGHSIGRFMVNCKGKFIHLEFNDQSIDPAEILESNKWYIETEIDKNH